MKKKITSHFCFKDYDLITTCHQPDDQTARLEEENDSCIDMIDILTPEQVPILENTEYDIITTCDQQAKSEEE